MIFAWHGLHPGAPRWDLPPEPDTDDWCELGFRSLRFRGTRKDTTENVVDLAHLNYVHDYDNVARIRPHDRRTLPGGPLHLPPDAQGARHAEAHDGRDRGRPYPWPRLLVRRVQESVFGLETRLWVLVTPLDGTEVEQVIVSQMRNYRRSAEAVGVSFGDSASAPADADRQSVYVGSGTQGRAPGRGHLATPTAPRASAVHPRGRGNHAVPSLLRTVLRRASGCRTGSSADQDTAGCVGKSASEGVASPGGARRKLAFLQTDNFVCLCVLSPSGSNLLRGWS